MDVISFVSSIIPFIVVISIVITVHELGHYWVGRMFNAAAESFAVGFGSPIFEVRDKRGTRWRVNWLPLGGFVKFVGEIQAPTDSREDGAARSGQGDGMGSESVLAETAEAVISAGGAPIPTGKRARREKKHIPLVGKAFPELNPWKRMAISLGGPVANFIFAIVVFAGMSMALGIEQAEKVSVSSIVADSPAEAAGFKVGDVLVTAGGRKVGSSTDVFRATQLSAGEAVRYTVLRDGQILELTATPKGTNEYNKALKIRENVGKIGLAPLDHNTFIRHLNPAEALAYGVWATGDALSATLNVMRRLVTGKDGLDKLSGPVGIGALTDNITDLHLKRQGVPLWEKIRGLLISLVQITALLSIGVGFFNLLPIPMLDGGAVVKCAAEGITGREVPEKVEQIGLTIGLACLALFALVITWQDITKLGAGPP
jgi:regulator of sigma E protease